MENGLTSPHVSIESLCVAPCVIMLHPSCPASPYLELLAFGLLFLQRLHEPCVRLVFGKIDVQLADLPSTYMQDRARGSAWDVRQSGRAARMHGLRVSERAWFMPV